VAAAGLGVWNRIIHATGHERAPFLLPFYSWGVDRVRSKVA